MKETKKGMILTNEEKKAIWTTADLFRFKRGLTKYYDDFLDRYWRVMADQIDFEKPQNKKWLKWMIKNEKES